MGFDENDSRRVHTGTQGWRSADKTYLQTWRVEFGEQL